jgi:acetylornithine deacetylase
MRELVQYVEQHSERLVAIARDLVRLPSENTPPEGAEAACQQYVAKFLTSLGWEVDVYEPTAVAGLEDHPLYWRGRSYANRPNVTGRRRGSGGGRSLLLSGHVDTVPRGYLPWTRDPFGAELSDGRLYGRGSMDMKAGVAISLFLAEALGALDARLDGDLMVETVVDEEFGGVNGTLAGRVRGYTADAAIVGESSGLRIIPAQRGGRLVHITFQAAADIFADSQGGVIEQLRTFLNAVPRFAELRAATAPAHPYYRHLRDRAPVSVTRIFTAPWGNHEPITVPAVCKVELFWQSVPGETQTDIERQFHDWFEALPFDPKPQVEFPIRWLPGSAIEPAEPLVTELAASARAMLGREPVIEGMEAPCDMYVFHEFGVPAVLWGPRGAGAHSPDEYVEVDSMVDAARVLFDFTARWCSHS